jgi:1-acyl-sn-glycerol-3-phosphate acyltransferase
MLNFYFLIKWIRRLLLTVWFWTGVAFANIVTSIIVLVTFLALPRAVSHDFVTFMIENVMSNIIMLWMELPGFWKVNTYTSNVADSEITAENGPFILAANHNSMVDTLFISLLPYRKSYTYNAKYKYAPLFGQLCVAAGYVDINMSSPEERAKCTQKIGQKIQEGYSMMLYPEGTRNKTPYLGVDHEKLKSGLFRISSETGTNILPIKFIGTEKLFGSYGIIDSGEVKVIFCKPYKIEKNYDIVEERKRFAEIINKTPEK